MSKWLGVAVLTALTLSGCPEPTDEPTIEAPTATESRGGESPEAVFERARVASQAGDWRTFYACLTERAGLEMLGGMIFGGAMVAASEGEEPKIAYEAMLATHGVKELEQDGQPSNPEDAILELAKMANDKPACLQAVMTWLATNAKDFDIQLQREMSLGEVEMKGDDAAEADVTFEGKAGLDTDRWAFTKADGLWLMDGTTKR